MNTKKISFFFHMSFFDNNYNNIILYYYIIPCICYLTILIQFMYILFLSFLFTPPTEIYLDSITFIIVYLHFFFCIFTKIMSISRQVNGDIHLFMHMFELMCIICNTFIITYINIIICIIILLLSLYLLFFITIKIYLF